MALNIFPDLKKLLPHLLSAREANLNEADTVQRITMVLEDVLGYSRLSDIGRETQLKGKFVDIAIKIDGTIRWLLEAKSASTELRQRHIDQAEMYASKNNIHWVVLTNGVEWHLYHLTFDEGIESERVFAVDFSVDDPKKAAEVLALLHKQNIKKRVHEEFLNRKKALSASSLGRALFHEATLSVVRREIRKNEGYLIDIEDLAKAIQGILSLEAREQIGALKIRKASRKPRAKKADPIATTAIQTDISEADLESIGNPPELEGATMILEN